MAAMKRLQMDLEDAGLVESGNGEPEIESDIITALVTVAGYMKNPHYFAAGAYPFGDVPELDVIAFNLARVSAFLINRSVAGVKSATVHKAQYVLETLIADLQSRV